MTDIQVQMLGDTVVRQGGTAHRITSPKLRAVLALLLSAPGQVCTVETLAAELWTDPPPRAVTTVQTYLYQLRRQLDAIVPGASGLIATQPSRYETAFDARSCDLLRFQALADDGLAALSDERADEAVVLLGEALATWRGEPFADVPVGRGLAAVAARLRELHQLVELSLVDAQLLTGRFEEALPVLRDMVAAQPLAEGAAARLVTALARLGRTREARAVYDRLERRLEDELGLAPLPRLQRVAAHLDTPHRLIEWDALRSDERAHGDDGAVVARRLAARSTALPGRDREIRVAARRLARAVDARTGPQVVALHGPAGVGKTATAHAAARRICGLFPDGVLVVDLVHRDGRPRDAAAVAREILAGEGIDPRGLPDADVLALYRTWSADRRMLLLLDNARSTDQVARLLPTCRHAGVLVCGDVRLGGLPGARHLMLDVLGDDAAATVLRQAMGTGWAADPAAVRTVVRRCGGLPLAVHAAAQVARSRRLDAAGLAAALADDATRWELLTAAAPRLAERIERSWTWLDRDCRRAWLAFGARPDPFDVPEAAALLGVTEMKARSMINRLREIAVLREFPADGGHRFGLHDSARQHGRLLAS